MPKWGAAHWASSRLFVGLLLFRLAFDSSSVISFVRCDVTTPRSHCGRALCPSRVLRRMLVPREEFPVGVAPRRPAGLVVLWHLVSHLLAGPCSPSRCICRDNARGECPGRSGDTGHLASAGGHLRGQSRWAPPAAPRARSGCLSRRAPAPVSPPPASSGCLLSCHLGPVLKPFAATSPCNPFPWLVLLSLLPRHATTLWEHGGAPGCGGHADR